MSNNILLTGGCGYIGSHIAVELINSGYNVTIIDNLSNSSEISLNRIIQITNINNESTDRLYFYKVDIRNYIELETVFQLSPKFYACIHCAGLKSVSESVSNPMLYYDNNVVGTINLLNLMDKYNCENIIFSSSATVYGSSCISPITENNTVGISITNPYGKTKFMVEEIIKDFTQKTKLSTKFNSIILRYFNPIGAHSSGLIGEDPNDIPNNLMPYISQVAIGRREYLTIYGNDYNTHDGTGIRDYIHVCDLALGHLAALKYLDKMENNYDVFNLGTGNGYSVLDMVKTMEKTIGKKINYKIGSRRPGDIDKCYSDVSKAKKYLLWECTKTLEDMCNDLWKWQQLNPLGYKL